jgi:hypothetical protein
MSAHGASPKSNRMDAQGCDTRPPCLQTGEGVVFSALTPNPSPTLWELIPIAEPEFKKTAVDDPLLKVPPARRGNRVGAPFAVPLAKRGEPKGGGDNSCRTYAVEYGDSQATASNSSRKAMGNCVSPIMNFERAIGIRGVGFFSRGWRGGRDARVPSAARAGSASVSLAWRQKRPARRLREQARLQKTYPFKPCGRGERFAESCGVRKRQLQRRAEAPFPHSISLHSPRERVRCRDEGFKIAIITSTQTK